MRGTDPGFMMLVGSVPELSTLPPVRFNRKEHSMSATLPPIAHEAITYFPPRQVERELESLRSTNSDIATLFAALPERLGTDDITRASEGSFGYSLTSSLTSPLAPPEGVDDHRGSVNELDFHWMFNAYSAGTDQLAVGAVIVRANGGEYENIYALTLEAPNQNYTAVTETTVQGGTLRVVDGWWDALTGCLGRDCGSVCLGAAISCPKVNWIAFLACLAGRCGGCIVKCAACATCDCSWWCKWAAGCCNQ
ncbi:hypothetical protein [Streptomyces tubercidicus]|uniref:hypothetical protein n=1 Tax=Streptomyces tubercidicus TaxID=47759 RepID=UPI0022B79AF8|nr:hypothetical protein [Streptomyces tubercidicus]WAU10046.1 hypothetical protein STRTU_000095 [Streptomyces tubercidicus]